MNWDTIEKVVTNNDGDIEELQREIFEWANSMFPGRTAWDATCKLVLEEIPEWLQNPDDPGEYADLVIMILDIASLKGIDVKKAVQDKMKINRDRKWYIDPVTRTMHHVGD